MITKKDLFDVNLAIIIKSLIICYMYIVSNTVKKTCVILKNINITKYLQEHPNIDVRIENKVSEDLMEFVRDQCLK